jgi:hypothetical protein
MSELIFVCDHLTADGRSAIIALRDFLALLSNPSLELEPIHPMFLGDLIPSDIVEKLKDQVAADRGVGLPSIPSTLDMLEDPIQLIRFALSKNETSAFLRRCRDERVTVQAALCAASLKSFAEREPHNPERKVEIPIDIRNYLDPPVGETYGMFISHLDLDLDCSANRKLWDIARDAKSGLSASIQAERYFYAPTVFITITGKFPVDVDISTGNDISITNLGLVEIPSHYGSLTLESIYGPIINISRPGHRVLGVATFEGRMYFSFTSSDPDFTQYVIRVREVLRQMIM